MPLEQKSGNKICKCLRTKMYYVNMIDAPDILSKDKDDSSTQYWCLKTMQTAGPDNGYVHRDTCINQNRTCFEAPDI